MYCVKCGAPNPEGYRFCHKCGSARPTLPSDTTGGLAPSSEPRICLMRAGDIGFVDVPKTSTPSDRLEVSNSMAEPGIAIPSVAGWANPPKDADVKPAVAAGNRPIEADPGVNTAPGTTQPTVHEHHSWLDPVKRFFTGRPR
jgi:hypothetical protein